MIRRYELDQSQGERGAHLLPGKVGDPGRHAADNRLFVHGVLWVLRSGTCWSDLPPRHTKYKTVYKTVHRRFGRWADAGVWAKAFAALIEDPPNAYVMLDASLVYFLPAFVDTLLPAKLAARRRVKPATSSVGSAPCGQESVSTARSAMRGRPNVGRLDTGGHSGPTSSHHSSLTEWLGHHRPNPPAKPAL